MTSVTKKVTIVTIMDTKQEATGTPTILFGKTRQAVLSLLFGHSDRPYYLREIVRNTGIGLGPGQREIKQLSQAGIIKRTVRGHQVYYQANIECPVFDELKSIVIKTVGMANPLRYALKPFAKRIRTAFIYGSIARGEDRTGSDLDIIVVGNVTSSEIHAALSDLQKTLSREINVSVYPPEEFRTKIKQGHRFLKSVATREKIFLIGDANEFAKLVK